MIPTFALAYARLGTAYGNLGEFGRGRVNRDKAFELRGRASEREKLYITAHYYDGLSLQKGIEAYELYRRTYPRDDIPWINLGWFYDNWGDFQKELEYALEAIRIAPESYNGYSNAADAYAGLGRLDEAQAILETARKKNIGGTMVHFELGRVAIARGDWATLERENAMARQGWTDPFPILQRDAQLATSGDRCARPARLSSAP